MRISWEVSVVGGAVAICASLGGAQTQQNQMAPQEASRGPRAIYGPLLPPGKFGVSAAPAVKRGKFVSVQVNVDANGNNILRDAANEPSLCIDTLNPNRIAIGWRQFDSISSDFRQAGFAYSQDGGATWRFPGVLDRGVFRSDPVLAADSNGTFLYYSLTTRTGNYTCDLFRSTDGGVTWTGPKAAFGGDKAWTDNDRTGGIGAGHFYAAWDHAGCCGDNWFTRSRDGGGTFDAPVPIPGQPIWGVLTVGPDGAVYVAGRKRLTNKEFVVAKSTTARDPGKTVSFDFNVTVNLGGNHEYYLGTGPNPGGLCGQVWIAADHSDGPNHNTLYMLCSVNPAGSDPLDVNFVRSTDGGLTWSAPVRISDDDRNSNAWQWFGTMSVAPNGRIDVVWNDTRNDATPLNPTYSEVFYSFSEDGGLTWSKNIPVTPSFNHFLGYPQQDKLGDYYDMLSDNSGASLAYAATFNGEQDVYFLRIDLEEAKNSIFTDVKEKFRLPPP